MIVVSFLKQTGILVIFGVLGLWLLIAEFCILPNFDIALSTETKTVVDFFTQTPSTAFGSTAV